MKFLLIVLATWRLTSLFSREEGPYRVFERIRHLVGVRDDGSPNRYGNNQLAEGLLCVWCCSVWFSTIVCVGASTLGMLGALDLPLYILAGSAGVILVDEVMRWLEHQQ